MNYKNKINNTEMLLQITLDIGKKLISAGAEIYRVENTVERICRAYGAESVEVVATPSFILCSITMDGYKICDLRRIKSVENNLATIEALNKISRELCISAPPLDEVAYWVDDVGTRAIYPILLRLLVAAVCAAAFTLFFGGKIIDAFFSTIIGVIVYVLDKSSAVFLPRLIKTAICAFISSSLCCIFSLLIIQVNAGAIMIGTVVFLVPGLAFGGALRNLIYGEFISGAVDVIRALFCALMIALGYVGAAFIFKNASFFPTETRGVYTQLLLTVIGVTGFAVLFGITPTHLPSVAIGGALSYAVYNAAVYLELSIFIASTVSAFVGALLSELLARIEKAPAIIFFLPIVTPILPGISLYNATSQILNGNTNNALSYFYDSVRVGLGIACGSAFVSILLAIFLLFAATAKRVKVSVKKNHKNH